MKKIIIEGSRKTPSVLLDPSGILKIEGRSIPEDANIFFSQIVDWVKSYVSTPGSSTTINFAFEYLNSGTSKFILEILSVLKELAMKDHPLTVNWYYEEGDDDILERGEYYASILDLKINFIEIE